MTLKHILLVTLARVSMRDLKLTRFKSKKISKRKRCLNKMLNLPWVFVPKHDASFLRGQLLPIF